MVRHSDVVVELPFEPREGLERVLVVTEEHVVWADLIALSRAVVVVAELLFLLLELALVAPKARSDLLLLGLRQLGLHASVTFAGTAGWQK